MAISIFKSQKFLQRNLPQKLLWPLISYDESVRWGNRRFIFSFPILLRSDSSLLFNSLTVRFHSVLCHFRPLPLIRRRFLPCVFSMSAPMSSDSSSATKTVRVMIKGRVQGVFYRDWTVENAKELGLVGWVRNRRDGSVEALFSGNVQKVDEMEQRCRRGPPSAMVTGLQVLPCSDDPGTTFERRQTA